MSEQTHQCAGMVGQYEDVEHGGNVPYNYIFRWEGSDAGWHLYSHDLPLGEEHRFCDLCNWCCQSLPVMDEAPAPDPFKSHRCDQMVRCEWQMKRSDPAVAATSYSIGWDGFDWKLYDRGEQVSRSKLARCIYCNYDLTDPRKNRNKVEIV